MVNYDPELKNNSLVIVAKQVYKKYIKLVAVKTIENQKQNKGGLDEKD